MKSNKGFSLVELLVVIAIMAIIAGVAIPVYSGYITKAETSKNDQVVSELIYAAQLATLENSGVEITVTATAKTNSDDAKVTVTVDAGTNTALATKITNEMLAIVNEDASPITFDKGDVTPVDVTKVDGQDKA